MLSGDDATEALRVHDDGNLTVAGDLIVSGDDIFMATNTSGYILVADGTNYNPVAISGDVTLASNGAITIANDAIDSEHYADGSIDSAHIADDQVTLAKMAGLTRGSIIYGDASNNPAALSLSLIHI